MISKDSHVHSPSTSKVGLHWAVWEYLRAWGHLEEVAVEYPQCLRATEQRSVLVQVFPWPKTAPSPIFPHYCRRLSLPGSPISVSSYLPSSPLAVYSQLYSEIRGWRTGQK